mgnify:CR=1 FL=1
MSPLITEKVKYLFSQQLTEWELAKTNYEQLRSVRTKRIGFGDFDVLVQFNPERIRSSAAKVDAKSVGARPCFLCKANRPAQQRDLIFDENHTILVNPFPIFNNHLTITCNEHTDQRIRNSFTDMLDLAKALQGFSVFYNGPQCGASAPDHLHFQAGESGFMPVESDFRNAKLTRLAGKVYSTEIWLWSNYLRGIITLKGTGRSDLAMAFDRLFVSLEKIQPGLPEPMLNIIVVYDTGEWIVHIIPRKKHRPEQFFRENEEKILVSPASVDLGGVMITAREEDFEKLNRDNLRNIFSQLCFDDPETDNLVKAII